MCKGGSRENTLAKYNNAHPVGRFPRRFDEEQPPAPPPAPSGPKLIPPLSSVVTPKDINKMFGITASDIDKYSRLIFPITFVCFQEQLKYHHESKAFIFYTYPQTFLYLLSLMILEQPFSADVLDHISTPLWYNSGGLGLLTERVRFLTLDDTKCYDIKSSS